MKNTKLLRICGVLGGGALLIAAFFFYFGTFISVQVGQLGTLKINGINFALGLNNTEVMPGITTAWVLSLLLLIAALAAIVFFVLDLAGVFTLKFLEKKNARLGIACCVGVLALVAGILLFCTRPLTDMAEQGVGIGASAFLAGLFTLLGGCALACAVALPALKK